MKTVLVALTAVVAVVGAPVVAKTVQPRITMQAARAKALALVPGGRVQDGELETEKGRLIYSFDIKAAGKTGVEEVQISALNGAVVSRKHETAAKEKAESRSEPKEHRRH